MRVAYLVNQYPRTSHSFIRREIHALEAQGVEVLRFSLRPVNEQLVTELDQREQSHTRIVLDQGLTGLTLAVARMALRHPAALAGALVQAVKLGWRSDRGVGRHLAYLAEACVLVPWLNRDRAEHLHAHFGTNSTAVALLCRLLGGPPFSFTVHGSEFNRPESLKLGEKIRHAAFAVAVSSFGRSLLYRWSHHRDWPKLHVIHCGLGEDLMGLPLTPVPAERRLVCVARFSPEKGHRLLVEAAARLVAEGINFELVLAGDGPLRGEIENLVRRLRLEDRVHLAGWMSAEEVRQAILSARALVLPSFAEGLPVVIMEALALGRPIVATAVAGIPELVEPGVTGWLVPAGSVEALVSAMKTALTARPEELEKMGRAGVARVARDHDARQEARKLMELFGSTANQRS